MAESATISHSASPVTVDSLVANLRQVGIESGDVVMVHTSMSAFGWVCGGPVAVIEALLEALGPSGTLAMPAHSTGLTDPSGWENPPVPPAWWPHIRATMPAFDARRTPTRAMGAVAELFRTWPGVLRSDHPTSSMAAIGAHARAIVDRHPLEDPMGSDSPLGRVYDLGGKVLLLGVGHDKNTSLHLAERRAFGAAQARMRTASPMCVDGRRQWIEYEEPLASTDDFNEIGAAFEATANNVVESGAVRAMRQRRLVDFAVDWLRGHRAADGSG